MIQVGLADPTAPDCAALLAQSHALMASMFAGESNHMLDPSALAGPDIRFFAARDTDDRILGIGALALRDGYAELKSLFTRPSARARGIGDALLRVLIAAASAEGYPIVRLETGRGLDAAHRLYIRHGFLPRGPFGTYRADPVSLFFERVGRP